MTSAIAPKPLRELLQSDEPHALLDVREQGEYNAAHIAGACWLPRRLIETGARALVPFSGTRTVVCDDDGARAELAAATLERMGYADVAMLDGGLNRWTTDGLSTEWGLNVPSKEFGERLFEQDGVPEVTPDQLHAWLTGGEELVLLDARTPEEHAASTIPTSRSLPGGELALRAAGLSLGGRTRVVVHCAGRTRSIVGARTLQRMGVPNVYALRNGTMGWSMAGYELETGSTRTAMPHPAENEDAARRARALADEDGVRSLSPGGLAELMATSGTQNVYLIDPRTREEYAAGHVPGFRWFPGGQAVQRADEVMAVRHGHVVFACDGIIRAAVTASWFAQMGFSNVSMLDGGTTAWAAAGRALETGFASPAPDGLAQAQAELSAVSPVELRDALASSQPPTVLFVGTSRDFSAAHTPGARWLARGWLEIRVAGLVESRSTPVVTTCSEGVQSSLAAATLRELGYERVSVLDGGLAAWRAAGLPTEGGLAGVASPPQDVVPTGTARTPAEMMHYLRWEEALGDKYKAGHRPGTTDT